MSDQLTLEVSTKAEEKPLEPGQVVWKGNWQVRNFKGYHQSREGGVGAWQFYVCGFDSTVSGKAGTCTVLLANGQKETVPIDARDRIRIDGRLYGRSNWNH